MRRTVQAAAPRVLAGLIALGTGVLDHEQAPSVGTGIITGRLEERDSASPVAHGVIALTMSTRGPAPPGPSSPPAPTFRVLTNADGRFVLHSLPAGSYSLSAARSGYLSTTPGELQVPEGGRLTNVVVTILKYASISGIVRDEAGEPAVGANVHLLARAFERGEARFRFVRTTTTDDRGRYRFGEIAPGNFLVVVPMMVAAVPVETAVAYLDAMAAGAAAGNQVSTDVRSSGGSLTVHGMRVGDLLVQRGQPAVGMDPPLVLGGDGSLHVYPATFHPSSNGPSAATVVSVASGEARDGVDIAMRPVRAVRVSGTVTGPAGPAPNLTVKFIPLALDGIVTSPGSDGAVAQAITRRDGTFTAVGIPAGDYVVSVVRAAGVVSTDTAIPGTVLWGRTKVSVGSVDLERVSISLSPGLTIAGRIAFDPGAIPPPAPAALQRARIQIRPAGSAAGGRPVVVSIAGDGSFHSPELAPGQYTMEVILTAPGWTLESISAAGRDVTDRGLDLLDDLTGVSVTFTDRAGEVTGSIAGVTPGAVTIVLVVPVDARAPGGFHSSRRRQVVVRTSAFRASNLLPGDYALVAFGGLSPFEVESLDDAAVTELARQGTRVSIGARETKPVSLTRVSRR